VQTSVGSLVLCSLSTGERAPPRDLQYLAWRGGVAANASPFLRKWLVGSLWCACRFN
jgi:hypothetical protein